MTKRRRCAGERFAAAGARATLRVLSVWLAIIVSQARAEPAIQYLTGVQPDGTSYNETRDFSDIQRCRALMQRNFTAAQGLGYRVSKRGSNQIASITYQDPKTGVAITQSCSTDKVFDPLPRHPTASFPNKGAAAGLAPPPTEVGCPVAGPRTAILFTFGQSNSANHGEGRYTAGPKVTVFHDGRCYQASDPLPGATGEDGSPWGRLGDLLVHHDIHDRVIIIAAGAAGHFISHWAPGGVHHPLLISRLDRAISAGYTPTALLWHQGEADAAGGTKAEAYAAAFKAMDESIRKRVTTAPVYVAVATICAARPSPNEIMLNLGPSQLVRQVYDAYVMRGAQIGLARSPGGMIRRGPNTDTIGPEFRFDGCHFSRRGLDMAARLWFDALANGYRRSIVKP